MDLDIDVDDFKEPEFVKKDVKRLGRQVWNRGVQIRPGLTQIVGGRIKSFKANPDQNIRQYFDKAFPNKKPSARRVQIQPGSTQIVGGGIKSFKANPDQVPQPHFRVQPPQKARNVARQRRGRRGVNLEGRIGDVEGQLIEFSMGRMFTKEGPYTIEVDLSWVPKDTYVVDRVARDYYILSDGTAYRAPRRGAIPLKIRLSSKSRVLSMSGIFLGGNILILLTDRRLYGLGNNNWGTVDPSNPTVDVVGDAKEIVLNSYLKSPIQILDIAGSKNVSSIVSVDGKAIVWGHWELCGRGGGLAIGTPGITSLPNKAKVQSISSGGLVEGGPSFHGVTFCVSQRGLVFGFGLNNYGEVGVGSRLPIYVPMRLTLPKTRIVVCGLGFSMCITSNHKLFGWGLNFHHMIDMTSPIVVVPQEILPHLTCLQLACGSNISAGIFEETKVYERTIRAWGYNADEENRGADHPVVIVVIDKVEEGVKLRAEFNSITAIYPLDPFFELSLTEVEERFE